jgi:type VI secretion system protein ImpH
MNPRQQLLWQRLQDKPYAFDLFQLLRRIEGVHPDLPRLGTARRPQDEPIRFAQEASLSFAPSAVARLQVPPDGPARLIQRVFGFMGPNGPLPLHLTEHVRERAMHHGDATMQRFLDMLVHRFGLLFYRAWTRSQPAVMLDRDGDASVERWLGSLFGAGLPAMQDRQALPDHERLYFASRLARQVRDADGLRAWIATYFSVAVEVREYQGHWMSLNEDERSRLTRYGQPGLGRGAVLGSQVWDVQHKFRIVLGPLTLAQYQTFLPQATGLRSLKALVRQYVGIEFAWDLQLLLRKDEVPSWSLGKRSGGGALGRISWLNQRERVCDANELVMNVEHLSIE